MYQLSRNVRKYNVFVDLSWRDVETEEKSIFKRVSRENQVRNHIFLLHHSVAGTRLKLQSKNKINLCKLFLFFYFYLFIYLFI